MIENVVSWTEEYSVENKAIDEQHKFLVQTTNDLYDACRQGGIKERMVFMKTIQSAVDYAQTHFSTEEVMMRKKDYPGYHVHKKEHEDFVAEVIRQVKNFEGNPQFHPEDFVKFLRDWILNHIAGSDKQYIPYLRD